MKNYSMEIGMTVYQMIEVEAENLEEAKELAVKVAAEEIGVPIPGVECCEFNDIEVEDYDTGCKYYF